ncbi:MAG: OmpA family protein [Sphingomonadaceae bacterium]|nr:OmpA family protein [Sphingomonadaceae bacterium]
MAAKNGRGKNELPPPIIVKKITVVAAGHHGGAWKVAYADFVTAMMAFFLLLWLLGATTEDQRKGLADYFTPTLVKLKEGSAGANGVLGGSSITDVDSYPNRQGQTGTRTLTVPRDTTGGPKEGAGRIKRFERLSEVKRELESKLSSTADLRRMARQVRLVKTREGMRIDLVDNADFSMFRLGTTVLSTDSRRLLKIIADGVSADSGELTIRGHTDALPWRANRGGNNWSLSAGRAEATRQALLRAGLAENRFHRIEGVADRELLIASNPRDPRNRRISILLMN